MLQLLLRLEKSNVPDLTPLAAEILKILRKARAARGEPWSIEGR